jgi:hypothetical protein
VSSFIVIRLDGEEYKVDLDMATFTAAELNSIERNTGMQWQEWLAKLADKRISSLAWTALAWVAKRRAGQFIPFDELADAVRVAELVSSVAPDTVEPVVKDVKARRR